MSHIVVNPEVDLPPRRGDEQLAAAALEQVELFRTLKKIPSFDKFPGSIVLRRYVKGEVICQQGAAGASAFYVLSTEDLVAIRGAQQQPVDGLQAQAERLANLPRNDPARRRASALFLRTEGRPRAARSFLSGLFGPKQMEPSGGPADDATLGMFEGDVFGEMSCMTLAPRSATVVADTDCYLLEFLRNIFDHIQRDAGYQQRLDAVYRERALGQQLARLPLLADVPESDLALLRQHAQLVRIEPGQIVFDQGDAPEAVYLVRSGMVQVVTDEHLSLRAADVSDWIALAKKILEGDARVSPSTPVAQEPSSATPPAESPATAPKAKPSAAEMLAAMKAKKEAAAAGGAPAGPAPSSAPSASKPAATEVASPLHHLYAALDGDEQAALRALATEPTASAQHTIIAALNARMRDRAWLAAKPLAALLEHADVARQTRSFPKGIKGLAKDWTDLEVRVAGRIVLELLLPGLLIRRPAHSGPPRVLSYLARGDIFGEIGVLTDAPRTATCIAYDHPPDPQRSSVPVDLVKIPAQVFKQFVAQAPVVQRRVDAILRQRKEKDAALATQPRFRVTSALSDSPDFQELGLIQGQKLLLIDLDRCTRCGDCVRACINTHSDGRSRLYLDGPRFDKYLVPSACRNCLNPACMIGCPVGSIQRGDDGQILIRDWCIGCGVCADQCPYDSIQMHDLGLVPNNGVAWRVMPADQLAGDAWTRISFRDHDWPIGAGPLDWNLELQSLLALAGARSGGVTLETPLCFRHTFDISRAALAEHARHEFSLVTQGSAAEIFLNGERLAVEPAEKRHRDSKKKNKGRWYEATIEARSLRRGNNVLAIKILPPMAAGEGVLDVQLVPAPGELALGLTGALAEIKQVTSHAVVCDLCGTLASGPACVSMCPHEAALRVDAKTAFTGA